VLNKPTDSTLLKIKPSEKKQMQKKNLLVLSVLAAVLLSSAAISAAAAQEEIPGATPNPSALPEPTIDPDAARKANENQPNDDGNSTGPDEPVTNLNEPRTNPNEPPNPDDITIQGSTTDQDIVEDAELYAAPTENSPDTTLILAVAGIVSAVVVGGIIGAVYYRKHTKKTEI
jgi:cytoskeletal protein RodZ